MRTLPRRVWLSLALALALLGCQPPAPAEGRPAGDPSPDATPRTDEPQPKLRRSKLPPKIEPPAALRAQDLPAAPELAIVALDSISTGELALPPEIGVVLPSVAVELEQGLLIAGQAFIEYDRQIRATQVWHYHALAPSSGEPHSHKGQLGSIRAGISDGQGGALLVGSLGVGLETEGWAARVAPDGTLSELAMAVPSGSDALDLLAGREPNEVLVLVGMAGPSAWMQAVDAKSSTLWQPEWLAPGFTQLRALTRLESQALLAVGSSSEASANAWWAIVAPDGGAVEFGNVELEGVDANRTLFAIATLENGTSIALGLARRAVAQDHDQVFAVGFDAKGVVAWTRAIDAVRATAIRGAIGEGDARFVLDVPLGEGTGLALLRISGAKGEDIRVEAIADTADHFSPGFVEGHTDVLALSSSEGKTRWRRLAVP